MVKTGWSLTWKIVAVVFLFGILGLIARIALFPLFVAGKVVDTAAGVVDRTMNANNALASYESFRDAYEGVKGAASNIHAVDKKIVDIKATYGADASKWPKDVRQDISFQNETRMGYVSMYNRLVTEYNANSRKLNKSLFKDWNLPDQVPLWTEP